MKHLVTLCLLTAPTLVAHAQIASQVTGQLRDEQPLPDTTGVHVTQTGADGQYVLAGA